MAKWLLDREENVMYTITVQVDAPPGSEQSIKEVLAMYLERFGDTRVISIKEEIPQQLGFGPQFGRR